MWALPIFEVRDLAGREVDDRLEGEVEAVAGDHRLEGGDALLRLHHLLVEGDGKAGDTEIPAAPRGHLVDGVDHRLRGLFARSLVGRGGPGGLLHLGLGRATCRGRVGEYG